MLNTATFLIQNGITGVNTKWRFETWYRRPHEIRDGVAKSNAHRYSSTGAGLRHDRRSVATACTRRSEPERMEDWMEPFARTIDAAEKYVVSSTLEWVNSNAEL